ncbi:MAG TPA: phasin family protein [Stellaceae bacterium]|nr:phasin family protein [Stellaceae bacterium]
MAKTTGQENRGRRAGAGMEGFPALDPTQFAANFEQMFSAGNRMLETWRVVSEELMAFGKSRLTRNIEVGRKVAGCASFDEAMEAQADYARALMQDYIAESSKIAELGTKAWFESLSVWQPEKKGLRASNGAETAESHSDERVAAE